MRIGFTGTREGMTEAQKVVVHDLILIKGIEWGHHGDCVGADADFHEICRKAQAQVKGHPPKDPKLRAFCEVDVSAPEKSYYARNRDIVTETDLLIATPKEFKVQTKGGTWYTVGYAVTTKANHIIVWPNGSIEVINHE